MIQQNKQQIIVFIHLILKNQNHLHFSLPHSEQIHLEITTLQW